MAESLPQVIGAIESFAPSLVRSAVPNYLLAGLAAEHVGDSRDRIAAGLDEWSRGWLDVRRRTCEAEAERRIEPARARAVGACLTRLRHRTAGWPLAWIGW